MKYLIIILCMVTIAGCSYFINESYTLNNRLDRVTETLVRLQKHQKPDSIEIFKQQFKEDSYIRELNNSVNLFLWIVAIVITVMGLLSVKVFDERVNLVESRFGDKVDVVIASFTQLKDDQNSEHNKHVEKYKALEHGLYDIRIRLNNTFIQSEWSTANTKEIPLNNRIMHLFSAVELERQNFILLQEIDGTKAKNKERDVNMLLQNFLIIFGDVKEHTLRLPGFQQQAAEILSNSKSFENPEITKSLSILFAKIDFTDPFPMFFKSDPDGKWESESSENLTFKEVPPPKNKK